jgi:hypothetical protein
MDWIPHTFTANVFTVQIVKVGRYTLQKLHNILLIFQVLLESLGTFKVSF